ncbi:MAG TPA: hypothetical protein PK705_02140 [Clostridia bacterium]|nr:hypothetical protein [Clostridia bacterium]
MINDFMNEIRNGKFYTKKTLKKIGTLKVGIVETTPVVWKGKLLRFEWMRKSNEYGYPVNLKGHDYYHFVDMETGESTPEFGVNHIFGCPYVENGIVYVYGVKGSCNGSVIDMFWSEDLINWRTKTVFDLPGWAFFNTSVCKGHDGYIMAVEINKPAEYTGKAFTILFAKSKDLFNWEFLSPMEHSYSRDRYTACPTIRFFNGQYYMIYLEAMPLHRYMPYIVRSKDIEHFELGMLNPFMTPDNTDKLVITPDCFTKYELEYINSAVNCNNSDVDLCEYKGKTVILYSWGNQLGKEFLALAEYDGTLQEFLESFF